MNNRIFAGVYPTGILYADREREEHGDYARLGFLPFDTLDLQIDARCPAHLRADIEADAAPIIARRGETYQISTSGQTVTLGTAQRAETR